MTVRLTAHHLLRAHEVLRNAYPDTPDGCKPNTLDSVAKSTFMEIYGHMPNETVLEQAAFLMLEMIKMHPFADGNKRTALLSTALFLHFNEKKLMIDDNAANFVVMVACRETHRPEEFERLRLDIVHWLEEHSRDIDIPQS